MSCYSRYRNALFFSFQIVYSRFAENAKTSDYHTDTTARSQPTFSAATCFNPQNNTFRVFPETYYKENGKMWWDTTIQRTTAPQRMFFVKPTEEDND